eukprot:4589768-Amphidinium_carterae.1
MKNQKRDETKSDTTKKSDREIYLIPNSRRGKRSIPLVPLLLKSGVFSSLLLLLRLLWWDGFGCPNQTHRKNKK